MRRTPVPLLVTASAVALLTACGGGEDPPADAGQDTAAADTSPAESTDEPELSATLVDPDGTEVGTVEITEVDEGTEVVVEVDGLPPGFHGLHLHSIGVCEPDSANPTDPSMTGDFLSAGGHIGAGESDHGQHPGDLPSLYVAESGTGSLTAVTGALTPADLTDDDGSAVMVHAGADNFANIPERYAAGGPDETTRGTGDSGGRIACGAVEG
ncbi:superoxide dismutase family protein [Geodermatophilus sp. YIM 151500]|uniref:superoxide dismutase family protein n=1 Tax=Geodermatophilus sp. YIM 151500 TaxID=2984531 RepID=UPI0021E44A92|nr:superoxide dismutase family protein [Geodermatophilus sp. YIM 151500]MCV2487785.1 superoxide dismutase family protein [Geodermatophilus sp. YIM 151500]